MRIFVCSPYRGNVRENVTTAQAIARYLVSKGDLPIVPHLYFPQFLDDSIPEQREMGIQFGLELMKDCDAVYVFGSNITEGMRKEIIHATSIGKTIKYFDLQGNEYDFDAINADEDAKELAKAWFTEKKQIVDDVEDVYEVLAYQLSSLKTYNEKQHSKKEA